MLLGQLRIRFQTIVPDVNEEINEKNPDRFAIKLAQEKVRSVQTRIKQGVIIGVDTIVVIDNEILGKPGSKKEAYQIIERLSGRTHQVISGLYILSIPSRKYFKTIEKTIVRFYRLSRQDIINYINSDEPYDKAGGYGIQSKAGRFIESINGCYYNVVGLPITRLLTGLKKFAVII